MTTSMFNGFLALTQFRSSTGPVIRDQVQETATWLVPVGSADAWQLKDVEVFGQARDILVPPLGRSGAIAWWVEPPVVGDCLTDPELLHAALVGVSKTRRRWDEAARRDQ